MGWATEGIKSAPGAGTILADTGALLALSAVPMTVVVWAKRTSTLVVAQRNATNTADVEMQRIYAQSGTEIFPFSSISCSLNDRFVVRCEDDADSDIQVSIMW